MKRGLMKKVAALGLSLATLVGMTVTGVAAEGERKDTGTSICLTDQDANGQGYVEFNDGKITVNDIGHSGDVYDQVTAYKIVNIKYDKTHNNVEYEWANTKVEEAVKDALEKDTKVSVKDFVDETKSNSDLSKKAYEFILKSINEDATGYETKSVQPTASTAELTGLSMGQYIIQAVGNNVYGAMTATFQPSAGDDNKYYLYPNVIVDAKTQEPTIVKTVDKNPTAINEYRHYTIEVQTPVYPAEARQKFFRVKDTMDKGLKGVKDLKIVNSVGTTLTTKDYTVTYNPTNAADATEFTISFDMDSANVKGQKLTITYDSLATAELVPGTPAKNKAEIQWPKNIWSTDNGYNTKPDEEKVYTYGIKVQKKDAEGKNLAGAEFKLYEDEACTKEIHFVKEGNEYVKGGESTANLVCNDTGLLTIKGLDEGTYYLKEMKAPSGYTLQSQATAISITKKEDGKYVELEFVNHKGFTLPMTGDNAMYMMSVAGVAVALFGVVLFINTRRKHGNQ